MGRKSAKGKSSDGKCRAVHIGCKIFESRSTSPDARKTLTATKRPKRAGKIFATERVPATTPSVKAEYTLTFFMHP